MSCTSDEYQENDVPIYLRDIEYDLVSFFGTPIEEIEYAPPNDDHVGKPIGGRQVWFSTAKFENDGLPWFAVDFAPAPMDKPHQHVIGANVNVAMMKNGKFPPNSQQHVLGIQTADDFDAFHNRFSYKKWKVMTAINWKTVGKKWGGIQITPYRHDRRFDKCATWYYSWDTDTCVVWSRDAIVDIGVVADTNNTD